MSVRSCIDNFTCPRHIKFETIIVKIVKLILHLMEEAEKGIIMWLTLVSMAMHETRCTCVCDCACRVLAPAVEYGCQMP